jgi:hypothetical protein
MMTKQIAAFQPPLTCNPPIERYEVDEAATVIVVEETFTIRACTPSPVVVVASRPAPLPTAFKVNIYRRTDRRMTDGAVIFERRDSVEGQE